MCFAIAGTGAILAVYLMVLGRVRLQAPRLEAWLQEDEPAVDSPPLARAIRAEGFLPEPAG